MLSRRLIRIKILQLFYAYQKAGSESIAKAEKELLHGINKTYDLYLFIFIVFYMMFLRYAEDKIEIAKQKNIPSYEDLHPNTKFINNRIIRNLINNEEFQNELSQKKLVGLIIQN